jgi:Xaa-Pro aminopeptidase
MLRDLRAVKDAREIAAIRRAVSLTDEMFSDLIPWLRRRMRRVDVTEREIASWIKAEIDARGGEGPSFPPIVAAGSNSARPHAVPGNRKVRTGQFLLFDFGLILDGHCSDMTCSSAKEPRGIVTSMRRC